MTSKVIKSVHAGDVVALRIAHRRICPPRRERLLRFDLPPVETAEDTMDVISSIYWKIQTR